jgi:glycolate oxidase
VEHASLYFAPDPPRKSCTIGGNVAENSGGPHTLAYGLTTNHIAALELVLPDGEIVRISSRHGAQTRLVESEWFQRSAMR